jgi:biotin carboxyl carrier protein
VRLEVAAAGRTRTVHVAGFGGRYHVDVDTRRRDVDAIPLGRGTWSLLIAPSAAGHGGGRSYEIGVVERAGELTVYVNGRAVPVRIGGQWRRRGAGPTADTGSGPQAVAAPMPGRVVKLLVKPGDAVQARQGLVVVEAMKMENELRAARAGVVREIRVAEGASVEANMVLVVLD